MWIQETQWVPGQGWRTQTAVDTAGADLVIYFGNRNALRDGMRYNDLRATYPNAKILGCSATYSIVDDTLDEEGIVAVALGFSGTRVRIAHGVVADKSESRAAGEAIGAELAAKDLAGVFVLADGLRVDGSELVTGLCSTIGVGPLIVGGMASDPREYTEALVGADCAPRGELAAAVGFYGDAIRLTHGNASGWDAFGPRRRITRSTGNVLHDLDGKPAIELYERYLGDEISVGASWNGVIFPLIISPPEHPEHTVVRMPLAVNEGPGSMTFAGHMPEGWIARLMRGSADRLALGAGDAARQIRTAGSRSGHEERLAIIVSCAGRQQMMGQRTEEELEVAGAEFDSKTKRIGFYSYGEIAPMSHTGNSALHNQTMIVVSLSEVEN